MLYFQPKTHWEAEELKRKIQNAEFKHWLAVAKKNHPEHSFNPNTDFGKNAIYVKEAKELQTLKIGAYTFQIRIEAISNRLDSDDWSKDSSHYQGSISRLADDSYSGSESVKYTFQYSQGSGYKYTFPRARAIFESLVLDATSGIYDFEEFCDNFGYDTDSRKAEKTWLSCVKCTRWFAKVGIKEDDLYALEELIREEEEKESARLYPKKEPEATDSEEEELERAYHKATYPEAKEEK